MIEAKEKARRELNMSKNAVVEFFAVKGKYANTAFIWWFDRVEQSNYFLACASSTGAKLVAKEINSPVRV